MKFDLVDMRILVNLKNGVPVDDTANFLNMSPSAISHRMIRLRRLFGIDSFDSKRGRAIARRCEEFLEFINTEFV